MWIDQHKIIYAIIVALLTTIAALPDICLSATLQCPVRCEIVDGRPY